MADYLPEGVIVNILQRLSVKNLICCTCVSKSWYSLITSPEFISSHLNFTSATEKDASLLLLRRCLADSECYSLYTDEKFCTWNDTLKFPFTSINSYFTIIGNCNGLLCLSDDRVLYLHTIILWNPCIRKSIVLPKPNLIYNSFGTFVQSFGFGFDPISSDYKLVRITYVDDAQEPLPQVEIYRLSTGMWQDISYLALDCVIYNRSRPAYINGSTHWIANSIQRGDLIVSFDMCREVFRKMTIPASLVNLESFSSKDVVAYKGSLALVSWNLSGNDPGFCVWVMKEYGVAESWAKHFVMTYQNAGGGIMRPLWVRKNGGILVARQDGRVVSYDVVGDGVEDLRIRGSSSEEFVRSVHVDGYMESLVLLGRGPMFDDAHVRNILPLLNFGDGCGSSVNSYGCCYLRSLGNGFKHSHGSYAAHGAM
ncbi:F-box/kelch-repeat protein At3g23880-like [Henckelia pumila]|uniref:F-box/kelch-repeat protein At3g23880-like n=1 Tax=Henckelia pumila TaxID=405737 RepID=UPI003C6DFEA9